MVETGAGIINVHLSFPGKWWKMGVGIMNVHLSLGSGGKWGQELSTSTIGSQSDIDHSTHRVMIGLKKYGPGTICLGATVVMWLALYAWERVVKWLALYAWERQK